MQKSLLSLSKICPGLTAIWIFILSFAASAQGLRNEGAQIVVSGAAQIYVNDGGWENNGTFIPATSTVTLGGSTAQSIKGTNSTAFYNFTATGGGTKTFSTSATLSRLLSLGTNTVVNANEKLTLLATSTSNASVGPLPSGASITNNVIVQSYFTGGAGNREFRGISSPIDDQLLANKSFKQLKNYFIITGPGGAPGFDWGNSINPQAVTIKTYYEPAPLTSYQFTNLATIDDRALPGTGYFFFYRGNRTTGYTSGASFATGSKVVSPYAVPESVTAQYTGPLNQGNVDVAITYTNNADAQPQYNGYNLVGNPYASVIDWHAVRTATSAAGTNISGTISLVKQDGTFVNYYADDPGLSSTGASRYIMPGQAFYVKANASGTLKFTEASKDPYPSGTVMRFLSAPSKERDLFIGAGSLNQTTGSGALRLELKDEFNSRETVIAVRRGTSPNLDDRDVVYFAGGPLAFFSKSADDKNLAINLHPEFTASTEIELYVATAQSGSYSLNFTDLSAVLGTELFLEDSFLKTVQNVNLNPTYAFNIDRSTPASFGSDRFKLVFRPALSTSNFIASKVYGGSEIKWSGLGNANVPAFVVERSKNGQDFTAIGTVSKLEVSNASYTYVDSKPENGTNYYRLKLPENDGKFSYTTAVSVDYIVDTKEPNFIIYPNPVQDVLQISFKETVGEGQLDIFNLSGQRVKSFSVLNSGKASINLSDLPSGVFFIKALDSQGKELGAEKFIKE